MKSIAMNHFPHIVFEKNERLLFNPVLKKRFKNRPEERVRLKWIEYLLHQTDRKKSRIGFEAPVKLRQENNTLRADLVLYDNEMKPEILVECKAESVPLTQAVAEQAARYNSMIDAPYICLTNGINDFWFIKRNGAIQSAPSPLSETVPFESVEKGAGWWCSRGFCSPESSPELLFRLNRVCSHIWSGDLDWPIRYLDFSSSFLHFGLNHYYRVPDLTPETKLAISFLGSPSSGSYLVAILNQSGQNSGFLAVNLDMLIQKKAGSAVLYANREKVSLDAHKKLPLLADPFNPNIIENLPNFLISFFD